MKKIFDGVFDDEVHAGFLRFGRGEYKNKYLAEGKRQAKKWAIKTGPEYVNFLVRRCLEKVDGLVKIKGVIVSTLDFGDDEVGFEIKKRSNFQGVRKLEVDSEIEAEKILVLMDSHPRVFFALSFSGQDFNLKIKTKAPMNGKPGKEKEREPSADFCSLKTKEKGIVDELFFGVGDFGEVKISYMIKVDDIVYPENIESLSASEIRELAKRKGVIVREVLVDGATRRSEAGFVV